MSVFPMLESINPAKKDVQGIRQALFKMKDLALVFPSERGDSPFYSLNRHSDTLRFPPTLASVIYAALHKKDDPEYFSIIADAVTDDVSRLDDENDHNDASKAAGSRYDPESERLLPVDTKITGRLLDNAKYYRNTNLQARPDKIKARRIVIGFLNNPEELKQIGDSFSEYLIDLEDYIEGNRSRKAMLEDISVMVKAYRQRYIEELTASKPVSDDIYGVSRWLKPLRADAISNTELYAYIACRMAEEYQQDVDFNSPTVLQDTAKYVQDWIEGEGVPETNEYQTGEGRSEYKALEPFNRDVSMVGAPVAPFTLHPLFAKDCNRFTKRRGETTVSNPEDIALGYKIIADVLGVPTNYLGKGGNAYLNGQAGPEPDVLADLREGINAYIAELAHDTEKAKAARQEAIVKLDANYANSEDTAVLASYIKRQVFQVNPDGNDKYYPGIAGEGDEIRLRKTSVEKGDITSRILRAVKKYPGMFEVVADDKNNGSLSVKFGNEVVTFDADSPEMLDKYVLPTLFPYIDSNASFVTYAEWIGVVPYSRIVDNQLEFLNDESAELNAVRKHEGPEIASDAIDSMPNKEMVSALTRTKGKDFNGKLLDKGSIISTLPKFSNAVLDGLVNTAKATLDDTSLQASSIIFNILRYNIALQSYLHKPIDSQDSSIETAACRYAGMDVFGNIRTLMQDIPIDSLIEQVKERSKAYAAVLYNNDSLDTYATTATALEKGYVDKKKNGEVVGNVGKQIDAQIAETRNLMREMCVDFIGAFETRNMPQEISDAYNEGKTGLNAFKAFLLDSAASGIQFLSGFGFQYLNEVNIYAGGKYDSGNRMIVKYDADEDVPLGALGDRPEVLDRVNQSREDEIDTIKSLTEILDAATIVPNNAETGINQQAKEAAFSVMRSTPGLDQKYYEEALDAFSNKVDPVLSTLVETYAAVYATLTSIIVNGAVTSVVRPMLNSSLDQSYDSQANNILGKLQSKIETNAGLLYNIDRFRTNIRVLSNNGKLLEPIYNAFRGKSVGDEGERMAYGSLIAAASNVVKGTRDAEELKRKVAHFFVTNPRELSEYKQETVPLSDMGEDENAVEQNYEGIGEIVADRMANATPKGPTYAGMTGYLGFDTIKVGEDDAHSAAMRPLTAENGAFAGMTSDAVQACADYIQSARDDLAALEERVGKTQADIVKSENPLFWADDVIDTIGSRYMESRLQLQLDTSGGKSALSNASGESWKTLVSELITALESRCGIGKILNAGAAALRNELSNFLSKQLNLGTPPYTLADVSRISTALAHIILRVGDMTKTTATPNPFAGLEVPGAKIPSEMQNVAAERMYPPGNEDDEEGRVTSKSDAANMLNQARDSVTDENLAHSLEGLYQDFGMGATSGARDVLDYFVQAAHDVDNKLHRTDTNINVGIAPNSTAAKWYGLVLDSERQNDRTYKLLKGVANEWASESKGTPALEDVAELLELDQPIENGPDAGTTYADKGFNGDFASSAYRPLNSLNDPQYMDGLVRAIRYQVTDRLLSNPSFGTLRKNNPELMERIAGTFFALAGNLDGGKLAAIFAALDPAERNAAHAAFTGKMRDEINSDETLGAAYDADEFMKSLTGEYPNREINKTGTLRTIVNDILRPSGNTPERQAAARNASFAELQDLAGADAVKAMQDALALPATKNILSGKVDPDTNETIPPSEQEIHKLTLRLCDFILRNFGTNPRDAFDSGSKTDIGIAKASADIAQSLYDVLMARKDASRILKTNVAPFISDVMAQGGMPTSADVSRWASSRNITLTPEQTNALSQAAKVIYPKMTRIKNIMGNEYIQFVELARIVLEAKNHGDNYEIDAVKNLMNDLRTSGGGGWYHRIISYADNIQQNANQTARRNRRTALNDVDEELETLKRPAAGSVNAANARTRAVGGNFGTSYLTQFNNKSFDNIKETVRNTLEQIPVPPKGKKCSQRMINEISVMLGEVGFNGSVTNFCTEVQEGIRSQSALAKEYASDDTNYKMSALRKYLGGEMGALATEAGKIPHQGALSDEDIRLIARSNIPVIHMMTDSDGYDTDAICIGHNDPVSVDSPIARMQMNVLVNKAESMLGGSVFDKSGNITREGASALAAAARGNITPVDPTLAIERFVPAVVKTIQNAMDTGTGRRWAVRDSNGNFIHKFTDGAKNEFEVKFGEATITKIVRSLFNSKFSDATQGSLKQEINEYLTSKKTAIPQNVLSMIENKIKNDVNTTANDLVAKMVKSGDTSRSEYGVTVNWLNPPEPENPPPVRARGPVRGPKTNAPAPKPVAAPAPEPVPPANAGAPAPKKARAPRKPKVNPAAPPPASEEEPV